MSKTLEGKCVAILATDGFEQSELLDPQSALRDAGAETDVISLKAAHIHGWMSGDWGDVVQVDARVDDADASDYDALLLPGGVINSDRLRIDSHAIDFVKAFCKAGKPIAAICHGPWMLIEANVVRGRKVTSWPSLRTDLQNAGAEWIDAEVVSDQGLVTSRKPDDLAAFSQKLIEEIAEGQYRAEQSAA